MVSKIYSLSLLSLPHSFSLCDRYDKIATKVYEDPHTTEDMVELVKFLTKVSSNHTYCSNFTQAPIINFSPVS